MAAASHGHNPAAWTGVTITFIGFCVSGVAMIIPAVWLFWVGMVVVVLGGVVGKAMSMAGMGKQATTHTHAVAAAAETKTAVTV
ncbi:HGxxPAAW family protein [Kitasatospora sp. NPDC002227]|uniref:HGxxPAAW family protein n=1 Tax=Kitasatospora sp. NPDC002227 TaxID=3154773 RepID=UPI00331A1DCA